MFEILKLLVLGGVFFTAWMLCRRCVGAQRGSWIGASLFIALLFMLYFGARSWRSSSDIDAPYPKAEARRQMERAHLQVERAHRQIEAASRNAQLATRNAEKSAESSIHQLWEQLNQPRIDLEGENHAPTTKVTAVLRTAPGTPDVASVDVANSESIDNAVIRLERLVGQVSSAAQKVTDAGTLIGRGLVAFQRSTDAALDVPQADGVPSVEPQVGTVSIEMDEPSPAASTTASRPRPAWVDDPPKRVGNTWREVLVTDEFTTREECYRDADRKLLAATFSRLRTLNNQATEDFEADARRLRQSGYTVIESELDYAINPLRNQLQRIGIGIDYIRREIAKDEYFETTERSFGPMTKLYTQIEFTPAVDREIREHWAGYQRQERFALVGVGAGAVLGLLGLAYGLLKVDTWTRGYYSRRLFLGVPAAIIGLVTLLAFMTHGRHW